MPLIFLTFGVPSLLRETSAGCQPVPLRYRKALAVLAYLLVERKRWHERERLACLFWPENAESSARNNLRQILKSLGDTLTPWVGEGVLIAERHRVGLFSDHRLRTDMDLFAPATLATLNAIVSRESLNEFVSRYRDCLPGLAGEFLEGFAFAEGEELDEWLQLQRAAMQRGRDQFLSTLVTTACRCGADDLALQAAHLWVRSEPLKDEPAQALMTVLQAQGRVEQAIDAFDALALRLELAMQTLPQQKTLLLRQQIADPSATAQRNRPEISTQPSEPWEVRRLVLAHLLLAVDQAEHNDATDGGNGVATRLRAWIQAHGGTALSMTERAASVVFGLRGDAEQPVRRGLQFAQSLLTQPEFAATRIGLCAGAVQINPHERYPVVHGDLPNVAMRLASCAQRGEIMIDESLAQGLPAQFAATPLLPRRFQDVEGEVIPLRLSAQPSADHAAVAPVPAHPCFGREAELGQLSQWFAQASSTKTARGVLIAGEAGMGKTRLLSALASEIEDGALGTTQWVHHYPEQQHSPLGGLRAFCRRILGITAHMSIPMQSERLRRWLQHYAADAQAALFSVLSPFVSYGDPLAAHENKFTLFHAIITLFQSLASETPLLLVIEDLHWADESCLEFLQTWFSQSRATRLLIVMTSREGFTVELPVERVALAPLAFEATLALIQNQSGSAQLTPSDCAKIARQSNGLPLCAEYLARCYAGDAMDATTVFATLHQLLDRLGEQKSVLQAAAVMGTSFALRELQALMPGRSVRPAIETACALAILDSVGEGRYAFRHALLRECAYESAPPTRLREWHRAVAELLSAESNAPSTDRAEHQEKGEQWAEAIDGWHQCAEAALSNEFAADALVLAQRGLHIAYAHPGVVPRRDEIQLELICGFAAMRARGIGAAEANRRFNAIANLPANACSAEQRFCALVGFYQGSGSQGEPNGLATARRLEALVTTPAQRLVACYALGNSLFWRGKLAEAQQYQEEAVRLGKGMPLGERLRYTPDDPALLAHAFLPWSQWLRGNPAAFDTAATLAEAARRGAQPHAACFALTFAAATHFTARDVQGTLRYATDALALAKQYGFPLWQAVNVLFLTWVQASQAQQADTAALLAMIAQMSKAYHSGLTTARWFAAPSFEALADWPQLENMVDLALREADTYQKQYCVPDLLRMKAQVCLARGQRAVADDWMQRARDAAAAQGALAWVCQWSAASDLNTASTC